MIAGRLKTAAGYAGCGVTSIGAGPGHGSGSKGWKIVACSRGFPPSPSYPPHPPGYAPSGITTGPDGNLWFTDRGGNAIGMINPTTHAISEFTIPTANCWPYGITVGPDGNLWFTEAFGNKIGEINPTTHAITEFVVSTSDDLLQGG